MGGGGGGARGEVPAAYNCQTIHATGMKVFRVVENRKLVYLV